MNPTGFKPLSSARSTSAAEFGTIPRVMQQVKTAPVAFGQDTLKFGSGPPEMPSTVDLMRHFQSQGIDLTVLAELMGFEIKGNVTARKLAKALDENPPRQRGPIDPRTEEVHSLLIASAAERDTERLRELLLQVDPTADEAIEHFIGQIQGTQQPQ